MFKSVWDRMPSNVTPKRSLADSAYHGEKCLAVAKQHGVTPFHVIKKNARHFKKPVTLYEKMVSFWQHWPNRAAELYGKRNRAETAFSMIGGQFDHRIRCRTENGRENVVRSKIAAHNIRMLDWLSFKSAN
jgi:transposase